MKLNSFSSRLARIRSAPIIALLPFLDSNKNLVIAILISMSDG